MFELVRQQSFANEPRRDKTGFLKVTAKLISAFIYDTRIVQSFYFLNPKFQASSHLLSVYSPVCVGPGQNTRKPVFSQRGSNVEKRSPEIIDLLEKEKAIQKNSKFRRK